MTPSSQIPTQGEIWWVDFHPIRGREQDGQRPALVVSRDEMHESGLFMVLPGTKVFKNLPGRVTVPQGTRDWS